MTWLVTLHPGLTGDVATLSPSAQSSLVSPLLQIEQNGGLDLPGAPHPSVMSDAALMQLRILQIKDSNCVIAASGRWSEHEICILGLLPLALPEGDVPSIHKTVYDAWGQDILARHAKVNTDEVELLGLGRFMDVFAEDAVRDAEQGVLRRIYADNCRDMMMTAQAASRQEIMDLYNLNERQLHRLERRADFLLERLQHSLGGLAQVTLKVTFKDDVVFEAAGLQHLPQPVSSKAFP